MGDVDAVYDLVRGNGEPGAGDDPAGSDDVQFGDGGEPEDFGDAPFEVPEPPVTGDATVDGAVARVAEAARQPLDVQVAAYDAVHRALQDRLADVED